MSNRSTLASAFNHLMALNDHHENIDIGRAIITMENQPDRLLIDDAPGIVGNHQDATHKAILHLDFLYEDIMRYPSLGTERLSAYIDSQYGVLRANLIQALKPNGVILPEAAAEFTKRNFLTSPNVRENSAIIRVGHSFIKI